MATYTSTPSAGAIQKVYGRVVPYSGENYPVTDATNMKGGYRTVATNTVRLAIPASHRKHGMKVFQHGNSSTWRLEADLVTWVNVTPSVAYTPPFTRSQWTDGGGYGFTERTTWSDGRHEYRMVMDEQVINDTSHDWKYRTMPVFTFGVPFTGDPVAFSDGHDTKTGLIWGTFCNSMPNKNNLTPQMKGNVNGSGGRLHIHVMGRT